MGQWFPTWWSAPYKGPWDESNLDLLGGYEHRLPKLTGSYDAHKDADCEEKHKTASSWMILALVCACHLLAYTWQTEVKDN